MHPCFLANRPCPFPRPKTGLEMAPGDIAFKSNFATLDATSRTVLRRRADRRFEDVGPTLCAALNGLRLPSFPQVHVCLCLGGGRLGGKGADKIVRRWLVQMECSPCGCFTRLPLLPWNFHPLAYPASLPCMLACLLYRAVLRRRAARRERQVCHGAPVRRCCAGPRPERPDQRH